MNEGMVTGRWRVKYGSLLGFLRAKVYSVDFKFEDRNGSRICDVHSRHNHQDGRIFNYTLHNSEDGTQIGATSAETITGQSPLLDTQVSYCFELFGGSRIRFDGHSATLLLPDGDLSFPDLSQLKIRTPFFAFAPQSRGSFSVDAGYLKESTCYIIHQYLMKTMIER
jgi:hypothetical protein